MKKPTRKQVLKGLEVLSSVIENEDDIALRVGKDIGQVLLLPTQDRAHGAKFTTITAHRTERGLAREVVNLIEGVLKEVY